MTQLLSTAIIIALITVIIACRLHVHLLATGGKSINR